MHVISQKALKEFSVTHPNAQPSLNVWYDRAKKAAWQNFLDLRQAFPSADRVGNLIVFNISGNNYRLIAFVDYQFQKVFIRYVLTHAEYDKEDWKNDPWFRAG